MLFKLLVNSLEVHRLIHPLELGCFLFFADQITKLFLIVLDVLLVVIIHLSEFVALFNQLRVLSQYPVYIFFSHLFVVYSDVFHHLQLLLHPSRLPLQLFVDLLSSVLFFSSFSLPIKFIACLIRLLNQAFQSFADSLRVVVRIGNRCHLRLEIPKFILVEIDFLFRYFDFFF